MELKKRLYNRLKLKEMNIDINDKKIVKNNRTKEQIRLYNNLYYRYVKRYDKNYLHYAKEYYIRHKESFSYKYKKDNLEKINKKREIKLVEQRVKIEYPTENNKFILEI